MKHVTYFSIRITVLFLFFVPHLWAQNEALAVVASAAPANASVAYTKTWTAFHNPAVLSARQSKAVALQYQNRYSIKELSTGAMSFSLPTKAVDIGVAFSYFGYEDYHELCSGIAFSRRLAKRFSLAVQVNYYAAYFSPSLGYKGNIIAQVGLLSEIKQGWVIGFHAFNPAQTAINYAESQKPIPAVFALGSSYAFSPELHGFFQLDKEINHPVQWRFGAEYQFVAGFYFRTGFYGNPLVPSLGTGFMLNKWRIDLQFERQSLLGISSSCSLQYIF